MTPPPILAAPVTIVLVAVVFWCNRNVCGILPDDVPGVGRKQHGRPIPLAGIALLPVLLFFLCSAGLWWLAVGTAAVAVLGFLDDRGKDHGPDLGWRSKALVLAIAAAATATQVVDPRAAPTDWLLAVLLVFVLTNATNFLDNTDGVAAALAGTSLLLATGGEGPLAACAFAALGFLPWNWPRPALFVGDAGAYALGLCCGYVGALGLRDPVAGWLPALAPFAVQLTDFTQVIAARLYIGVSPFVGDRRHLTHVVQNLGLPRVLTAPLFSAAAALLFLLLRAR